MIFLVSGILKFGNSNYQIPDIVDAAINAFDLWANNKGNIFYNSLRFPVYWIIKTRIISLDKLAVLNNNVVKPTAPKPNVYRPPHRR